MLVSLLGGVSTSIGALFVIINQAPNLKMLGLLQSFVAGLIAQHIILRSGYFLWSISVPFFYIDQ